MYPDSVSGVHFLFSLIHRKSRFFSKFVNTYSGNKMGNDLATVLSAAFYLELLTRNSYFVAKIRILLIYKKHCTIYYVS